MTISDMDVKGKRVIVRVDFNVPRMQRETSLMISVSLVPSHTSMLLKTVESLFLFLILKTERMV